MRSPLLTGPLKTEGLIALAGPTPRRATIAVLGNTDEQRN